MAAHRDRAKRGGLRDQRIRALDDRRRGRELALLDREPLAQRADRFVRHPAITDEALVEVDVAIDEAGQHDAAVEVDRFRAGRGRMIGTDRGKAAVTDDEVDGLAAGIDGVDEDTIGHGSECGAVAARHRRGQGKEPQPARRERWQGVRPRYRTAPAEAN